MQHLTWLEIDLDAIAHNLRVVRERVGSHTAVMGVVKADAYGHGAPEVAQVLEENGADYLGVATVDEGLQLKKVGIKLPIVVLSATLPSQAAEIVEHDLIPAVFTREMLWALSDEAKLKDKKVKLHLKVESGMGRIGAYPEDIPLLCQEITYSPYLVLDGIFTHFSTAGTDPVYQKQQLEIFNQTIKTVRAENFPFNYAHVATSAVLLENPELKMDMVRPGIMLYGLVPNPNMEGKLPLKPALSLKARVVYVKKLLKETGVSYGNTYRAMPGETIATVAVGYADGYSMILSNQGKVLLKGQEVDVVGRVCMDSLMVNASQVPQVQAGDVAVLIGSQGNKEITVDRLADLMGIINYEVVTLLGKRHRKIFFKAGKITEVKTLNGKIPIPVGV